MKAIAVTLAAALLLAGCSEPDPAIQSDLEKVFASAKNPVGLGLPKKQAECAAKLYAESSLSQEYLQALAAGKKTKTSQDDREELADLTAKVATDCLSK